MKQDNSGSFPSIGIGDVGVFKENLFHFFSFVLSDCKIRTLIFLNHVRHISFRIVVVNYIKKHKSKIEKIFEKNDQ